MSSHCAHCEKIIIKLMYENKYKFMINNKIANLWWNQIYNHIGITWGNETDNEAWESGQGVRSLFMLESQINLAVNK